MRRSILAAGATTVVIIGSGSAFYWNRSRAETAKPKHGPIIESVYGLGTVKSDRTFNFKTGTTTGIRKIFVREGDRVNAGDALLSLDDGGTQRAPFTGTVTSINFKESETVFPQLTIFSLMDLSLRYIEVSLEQQGALRVRKDQPASLSFESLRGIRINGVVSSIFPKEGQFLIHIRVENLPPEILPGMTADVAVQVGQRENSMLVPLAAISGGKVVLLRDGHKIKTDVKVGIIDGEWAEIIEGDVKSSDEIYLRR